MKTLTAVGVLKLTDFGPLTDFSLYRDILILWDEDHDGRLLAILDQLLDETTDTDLLVAAAEHKGELVLWWWGRGGWNGDQLATTDRDAWKVEHRIILAAAPGRTAVRA